MFLSFKPTEVLLLKKVVSLRGIIRSSGNFQKEPPDQGVIKKLQLFIKKGLPLKIRLYQGKNKFFAFEGKFVSLNSRKDVVVVFQLCYSTNKLEEILDFIRNFCVFRSNKKPISFGLLVEEEKVNSHTELKGGKSSIWKQRVTTQI